MGVNLPTTIYSRWGWFNQPWSCQKWLLVSDWLLVVVLRPTPYILPIGKSWRLIGRSETTHEISLLNHVGTAHDQPWSTIHNQYYSINHYSTTIKHHSPSPTINSTSINHQKPYVNHHGPSVTMSISQHQQLIFMKGFIQQYQRVLRRPTVEYLFTWTNMKSRAAWPTAMLHALCLRELLVKTPGFCW